MIWDCTLGYTLGGKLKDSECVTFVTHNNTCGPNYNRTVNFSVLNNHRLPAVTVKNGAAEQLD